MFELIENLRQKSDKSKKKIAFSVSFCFVLLILFIWVTVIYPDFKFKQKQTAAATEASLSGSFFENIKEGLSGVKKRVNDLKGVIGSVATSTYYVSNNADMVGVSSNNMNYIVEPVSTSTAGDSASF